MLGATGQPDRENTDETSEVQTSWAQIAQRVRGGAV